MVIGSIIGEKKGKWEHVGKPGPFSKVKAAFQALVRGDGGGCSRLILLSTRGPESQRRIRQQKGKNTPAAGAPSEEAPPAEEVSTPAEGTETSPEAPEVPETPEEGEAGKETAPKAPPKKPTGGRKPKNAGS